MKALITSSQFRHDLKHMRKQAANLDLLFDVIDKLRDGGQIPPKYKDHGLSGEWKGYRDLHVENDWVLIYKTDKIDVYLIRTGSHSELYS